MKNRRGNSFIPLLVVLVVVGMLAYMAIPRQGEIGHVRLKAALMKLCEDVRYAQSTALAQARSVGLIFYEDGAAGGSPNTYSVHEFADETVMTDPSRRSEFRVDLNDPRMKGVTLARIDGLDGSVGEPRLLVFDKRGVPLSGDPGSFRPLDAPADIFLNVTGAESSVRVFNGTGLVICRAEPEVAGNDTDTDADTNADSDTDSGDTDIDTDSDTDNGDTDTDSGDTDSDAGNGDTDTDSGDTDSDTDDGRTDTRTDTDSRTDDGTTTLTGTGTHTDTGRETDTGTRTGTDTGTDTRNEACVGRVDAYNCCGDGDQNGTQVPSGSPAPPGQCNLCRLCMGDSCDGTPPGMICSCEGPLGICYAVRQPNCPEPCGELVNDCGPYLCMTPEECSGLTGQDDSCTWPDGDELICGEGCCCKKYGVDTSCCSTRETCDLGQRCTAQEVCQGDCVGGRCTGSCTTHNQIWNCVPDPSC